ncbi:MULTISPECIES: BC1872 family protein [Bacillus]|uniref:BC1872 family protein n=1 Tax=Bacillus TaxID=1386 RepID=UPI001E3773B7|nr:MULTISPECIES: hypothetical protein [Bacillus]MDA1742480.1 hypothetical protein [Bacillus cereus]MCC2390483.1 hypothetical protein [Bacillus pacificus]MCC2390508.1 hypothetical protein [Bacillus pacificus]MDA1849753.1 hypothetical protein [Bacillus cereus]MDF0736473.1 hypothetical protein [Bacillus pacificus]
MGFDWIKITNAEKDQLIAHKILLFDCFNTEEGSQWYQSHYNMGHWHYSSDIKSAIDLINRLSSKNIITEIKVIKTNSFLCRMFHKTLNKKTNFHESHSLPMAICVATLTYFETEITNKKRA